MLSSDIPKNSKEGKIHFQKGYGTGDFHSRRARAATLKDLKWSRELLRKGISLSHKCCICNGYVSRKNAEESIANHKHIICYKCRTGQKITYITKICSVCGNKFRCDKDSVLIRSCTECITNKVAAQKHKLYIAEKKEKEKLALEKMDSITCRGCGKLICNYGKMYCYDCRVAKKKELYEINQAASRCLYCGRHLQTKGEKQYFCCSNCRKNDPRRVSKVPPVFVCKVCRKLIVSRTGWVDKKKKVCDRCIKKQQQEDTNIQGLY